MQPATTLTSTIQTVFARYQRDITQALGKALAEASTVMSGGNETALAIYYGQMHYHLGWVNEVFVPIQGASGKLLRPTLLLLAYEMTATNSSEQSSLQRALPAAAAIELIHNFTLIHDDIEDADEERRHRPTVWKIWGVPQAINAGDGMIFVARLALWNVLDAGVPQEVVIRLSQLLDRTVLTVTEGQYLDMSFECRLDISVDHYLDMIGRKTAALMSCAAEMGALLGANVSSVIHASRHFGWTLGIAFQIRDDLLGIWGTSKASGKTEAGDIYRRKKSLPFLHALSLADEQDQRFLRNVYQQQVPITDIQVTNVLAIFSRTQTYIYCLRSLQEHCHQATQALHRLSPGRSVLAERAYADMEKLISFVADPMLL
jgi:geranylgeranyl diphosphate synthase type I